MTNKPDAPSNLEELIENTRQLIAAYIAIQKRIARLTVIKYAAQAGGMMLDGIVTIILLSIVLLFSAVTGALWLSEKTGSFTRGFGLMTLVVLAIVLLIQLFRKTLFINPVIHRLVRRMHAGNDQLKTPDDEPHTTDY